MKLGVAATPEGRCHAFCRRREWQESGANPIPACGATLPRRMSRVVVALTFPLQYANIPLGLDGGGRLARTGGFGQRLRHDKDRGDPAENVRKSA